MKVTINAEVFGHPTTSETDLIALFNLGYRGKCRLLTAPTFLPSVQVEDNIIRSWLKSLTPKLRQECTIALDYGVKMEATYPSVRSVLISVSDVTNWQAKDPVLSVNHAVQWLNRPLRLLVENQRNDRAFILATASPEDRTAIEDSEALGTAVFEHTGGLGEMLIAAHSARENRQEAFRMWAMFDGDRLQPSEPNPASERMKECCAGVFPSHQLERRSIENYLPISVLSLGLRRNAVVHKVRVFNSLTRAQRDYFNLKSGFSGDEQRNDGLSAGNLYSGVNQPAREYLQDGFGANVASLFSREDLRNDSWYETEGQRAETGPMIKKLLALI